MSQEPSREVYSCRCVACRQEPDSEEAQRHRDVNSLVVSLDEKARRLFVGLLASQHGRGGFAPFSLVTPDSAATPSEVACVSCENPTTTPTAASAAARRNWTKPNTQHRSEPRENSRERSGWNDAACCLN